jgi:hypothetical protein
MEARSPSKRRAGLREITNNRVSPRKKRRQKKFEKAVVLLAAQEVLSHAGGNAKYGSMPTVLAHYHGLGHAFVTRGKVQFEMLKMQEEGKKKPAPSAAERHPAIRQVTFEASATAASPMTDEFSASATTVTTAPPPR